MHIGSDGNGDAGIFHSRQRLLLTGPDDSTIVPPYELLGDYPLVAESAEPEDFI
jgi:hypothetical protein